MRIMGLGLLAGMMVACTAMLSPQEQAELGVDGTALAKVPSRNASAKGLPIGACINLGNFLEGRSGGEYPGKRLDESDLDNVRAAGFNTVRLPVNFMRQSDPNPPHRIDPQWLVRVTGLVDAARARGLKVILDNHNFFADVTADSLDARKEWLASVWKQLAIHFADRPTSQLWFELSNEPGEPINNRNLMDILGPSLAEIRKVSRTRPVIIGGERSSRVESLETLQLPDDPNVWPTFHYYEPFMFTHQGATWMKIKPPPIGRPYGVTGDADRLSSDIARVQAYIDRTGKIPFIGETGALDTAPLPQRVTYVRTIHRRFSALRVPQCYWTYAKNFTFYDYRSRMWLPGMLEAIGLRNPGPRPAPVQQPAPTSGP